MPEMPACTPLTRTAGSGDSPPPSRRTYSAGYKLAVLARAQELKALGRGGVQALLRAEGLRTSHLSTWRAQLARGELGDSRRGRPGRSRKAMAAEIRGLRLRLRALEKRLRDSGLLLELQRKYILASALRSARRDRGLLSELIARVEGKVPVAEACRALGVPRRDFYRTVRPRRRPVEEGPG